MRVIGILGGMSASSTALYYAQLNALVQKRLGGLHSANLLLRSVDFAPIAALQAIGDWDGAAAILAREARALQAGGAEVLILATNTMHKVADQILQAVTVPFIHIADATGTAITAVPGLRRPGLMATGFTMEQEFYTGRLRAKGLEPVIPAAEDRAEIHRAIYDELCRGIIREESRQRFEAIAARLVMQGADCLILGCTEVGMLLHAGNVGVPVFDTVAIHCEAALDWAMAAALPLGNLWGTGLGPGAKSFNAASSSGSRRASSRLNRGALDADPGDGVDLGARISQRLWRRC